MSLWEDFTEAVEDVGDTIVDIGEGIVEGIGNIAEGISDAVDWAGEAVSDIGDVVADGAEAIVDVHEAALDVMGDVGDTFLTTLEDSGFFDVVDFATVGLVDMEYSEAGFSFDVGIEDVFGVGFKVGEGGFGVDVDYLTWGVGVSIDDNGFAAEGRLGIDWGPLPNVGGDVSVDEEGQFGVGGHAEAYIPTYAGLTGGEIEADYQETPDGFKVSGSITARNFAPSGTTVGAGVHGSYEENAEGYIANLGVHAEVEQLGGPAVRASVDYTESRQGDVRTEGVSAGAEVEVGEVEVGGEVGYTHVETSKGEYDVVSGEGYVEAGGARAEADVAVASGPDGVMVTGGVSGDADLVPEAEDVLGEVVGAAGFELPEGVDLEELEESAPEAKEAIDEQGDELMQEAGDAISDELPELPEVPELRVDVPTDADMDQEAANEAIDAARDPIG